LGGQVVQQPKLGGGQLDRRVTAQHGAGRAVQNEVGDLHGGRGAAKAAQHRCHPRDKLCQRERLDQIVVGPAV